MDPTRPSASRIARAAAALACAGAATPVLDVRLAVNADGTPSFDAGDGGGEDSGPANGVVRTHDAVEYRVDWSVNGAGAANVRVTATLPVGLSWAALPDACQANRVPPSSIAGRSLVCNVGDRQQGEAGSFTAVATVASVPDGTELSLTAAVAGDGAASVSSPPVEVVASAGPEADLVFDHTGGSVVSNQPHPVTATLGKVFYLPVTMEVPGDGKGAEPLAAGQTLQLAVDLTGLPPSAEPVDGTWSIAAPSASWERCGPNDVVAPGMPFGTIGLAPEATALNSVVSSGSWTCSWDGTARVISVDVTGAELAPATLPSRDAAGLPLPPGRWILLAGVVAVWVSDADLQAISGNPGVGTLPPSVVSWTAPPLGVSGGAVTGEDPTNDSRTVQFEYTSGIGTEVHYAGRFGQLWISQGAGDLRFPFVDAQLDTVPQYTPFVPTQTQVKHAGDGTVAVGEPFAIRTNTTTPLAADAARNTAFCIQLSPGQALTPIGDFVDIDYRPVGNMAAFFQGIPPVVTTKGSGNPPWGAPFTFEKTRRLSDDPMFTPMADVPEPAGELVIEYSTDTPSFDGQCGSASSWSTTPPADLSLVTQVRVYTATALQPGDQYDGGFSLRALPQPIGSRIWHVSSGQTWPDGVPFDPDLPWYTAPGGAYDPDDWCDLPLNPPHPAFNDCLTIAGSRLQIAKRISSGKVVSLAAGERLTYTIEAGPVGPPSGTVDQVVVRDLLPAGVRFTGTANPAPTNGAGPGSSSLEWNLGTLATNTARTITVEVEIEPGYAPFDTIVNTATVDGVVDLGAGPTPLPQAASTANLQTSGIFAALEVQKSTPTPLISRNAPMQFELQYRNTGVAPDDNPTFIDVLPWNGDGRTPATDFTGTATLASVAAGGAIEVRYTSAAPATIHPDPAHPSNDLVSGATRWCLAASLGSPGCPVSVAGSTAVRLAQPGSIAPGASMAATLTIATSGNLPNDRYANTFTGRVDNIALPVTSNTASVRVRGVDVSVAKSGPVTAVAGTEGTFTITVRNDGPDTAAGVVVSDALPDGMELVRASDGGSATAAEPSVVRWSLPTLADGASQSVQVTVRFRGAGSMRNTASVLAAGQDDRTAADDAASAEVAVSPATSTGAPAPEPAGPASPPDRSPPPGNLAFTGAALPSVLVPFAAALVGAGLAVRRRTRRRPPTI